MKRKMKQTQALLLAVAILLMSGLTALAQEDMAAAPSKQPQASEGDADTLPGDEGKLLLDGQQEQPERRETASYTRSATKIGLYLSDVAVTPKEYDGKTDANISFILKNDYDSEASELKEGEDYQIKGTYATPDAGKDIPVTVTFSWIGTPRDSYDAPPEVSVTGDINPAAVTIEYDQEVPVEYGQLLSEADLTKLKAPVPGYFSWSAGCETGFRPGIDTGSHTASLLVDFEPDSANYLEHPGISISPLLLPAVPTPSEMPHAGTLQAGSPLSSSPISGTMVNPYLSSIRVEGSWAWKEGSTIPSQPGNFTAVFTPVDSLHYQTVEAEVFAGIKDVQTLTLTADKTSATYGDTITCTASAPDAVSGSEIIFYLDDPNGAELSRAPTSTASAVLDKTRLTAGTHTVYAVYGEGTPEEQRASVQIHIQKKQLFWDTSGLTAFKKPGSAGEAAVSGTLKVSGILDNEVVFTAPKSLKTSGFTAAAVGSYSVSVVPESGSWAFTPKEPANYLLPEGDPQITATVSGDPSGEPLYKVKVTRGISVVPKGLENTEFDTPEKIIQELVRQLRRKDGYTFSDEMVYDAVLMVSIDGGKTWSPATADDFPKEGRVSVTMPYPAGTGQYTHDFIIVHMFTENGFGNIPGSTEQPPVTNTEDGISFTVTGLSPIGVAWKARETGAKKDSDSGDSSGSQEYSFWQRVREKIADTESGGTVRVTTREHDPMPGNVLDMLRKKKDVTLIIRRDGKEDIIIPSSQVPEGILRPSYPLSELAETYKSMPDAAQGNAANPDGSIKTNPGTGAF